MMREGLRALLEEKLGYECVDEADDGYAAVNKAKEFKPDFVIMRVKEDIVTSSILRRN